MHTAKITITVPEEIGMQYQQVVGKKNISQSLARYMQQVVQQQQMQRQQFFTQARHIAQKVDSNKPLSLKELIGEYKNARP